MRATNKSIGLLSFAISLFLLACVYYFSYRAGCLFDGKQGYGDLEASEPYSAGALGSFFAAVVVFILSVFFWSRPKIQSLIVVFVIVILLAIPIFIGLSFEGAVHGTQACHPS